MSSNLWQARGLTSSASPAHREMNRNLAEDTFIRTTKVKFGNHILHAQTRKNQELLRQGLAELTQRFSPQRLDAAEVSQDPNHHYYIIKFSPEEQYWLLRNTVSPGSFELMDCKDGKAVLSSHVLEQDDAGNSIAEIESAKRTSRAAGFHNEQYFHVEVTEPTDDDSDEGAQVNQDSDELLDQTHGFFKLLHQRLNTIMDQTPDTTTDVPDIFNKIKF